MDAETKRLTDEMRGLLAILKDNESVKESSVTMKLVESIDKDFSDLVMHLNNPNGPVHKILKE